jgi:hypothetical protein
VVATDRPRSLLVDTCLERVSSGDRDQVRIFLEQRGDLIVGPSHISRVGTDPAIITGARAVRTARRTVSVHRRARRSPGPGVIRGPLVVVPAEHLDEFAVCLVRQDETDGPGGPGAGRDDVHGGGPAAARSLCGPPRTTWSLVQPWMVVIKPPRRGRSARPAPSSRSPTPCCTVLPPRSRSCRTSEGRLRPGRGRFPRGWRAERPHRRGRPGPAVAPGSVRRWNRWNRWNHTGPTDLRSIT